MYKSLTVVGLVIGIIGSSLAGWSPPSRAARGDATKQAQDPKKQDAKRVHDAAKKIEQLRESVASGAYKEPPKPSTSGKEKPLLSWRVHLLPYLEEQALYKQFHLDEPWNSENNKKLIDKMPAIYRTSTDLPRGKTTFVAPVCRFSAITSGSRGIRFSDVEDGASKTILFVQVRPECAVTWTSPADIQFDPAKPMRCFDVEGGFLAVFCDGSVHRIPGNVDHETLRRLVDRRDGQPVSSSF